MGCHHCFLPKELNWSPLYYIFWPSGKLGFHLYRCFNALLSPMKICSLLACWHWYLVEREIMLVLHFAQISTLLPLLAVELYVFFIYSAWLLLWALPFTIVLILVIYFLLKEVNSLNSYYFSSKEHDRLHSMDFQPDLSSMLDELSGDCVLFLTKGWFGLLLAWLFFGSQWWSCGVIDIFNEVVDRTAGLNSIIFTSIWDRGVVYWFLCPSSVLLHLSFPDILLCHPYVTIYYNTKVDPITTADEEPKTVEMNSQKYADNSDNSTSIITN